MFLIKAALPYLKEAKGTVLNIGSFNAYCGETNLLAYSISKGGLMTLSKNLADSLSRTGVRVNHFNVGWVLTPNEINYKIADGMPADWYNHVATITAPTGQLMKPEEIAQAALYWISPEESRPITGSVVDLEQYPGWGGIRRRNCLNSHTDPGGSSKGSKLWSAFRMLVDRPSSSPVQQVAAFAAGRWEDFQTAAGPIRRSRRQHDRKRDATSGSFPARSVCSETSASRSKRRSTLPPCC